MLPRYLGLVSATFPGLNFVSVGPPPAGNSDLVGFWPIWSLWHLEKFRARAGNTKTQLPGAQGILGEKSGRPKGLSSKFCKNNSVYVLANRTPTGGKSRNTRFLAHLASDSLWHVQKFHPENRKMQFPSARSTSGTRPPEKFSPRIPHIFYIFCFGRPDRHG